MSSASRRLFSFSSRLPARSARRQPGMLMHTSSSDSGFAADLHPRRKSEDRHHTAFASQSQGVYAKIPANFVPIGSRRDGRRFLESFSAAFPGAAQSMGAAYRVMSLSAEIVSPTAIMRKLVRQFATAALAETSIVLAADMSDKWCRADGRPDRPPGFATRAAKR